VRTQETKEDRECQVCLRRDKYIPDRDRLTVEFCFTAVSLFLHISSKFLLFAEGYAGTSSFLLLISTTFDTFSLQGSEELRLPEGSTLSSARARYGQFSAHDQHDLHDHGRRLKFFR
jgi:hypothetical protein